MTAKWWDAASHPSGAAAKNAGYTGVMAYVGTPGRAKSLTRALVNDYRAHGLQIIANYENNTLDSNGGFAAGQRNAIATMTDCHVLGLPQTTMLAPSVDRHVYGSEINQAKEYQRGFYSAAKAAGWQGAIGTYGFVEHTTACRNAGVAEWFWQCGSVHTVAGWVTFWQDNTGYVNIGGVQADINHQLGSVPTIPGTGAAAPAPGDNGLHYRQQNLLF